MKFFHDNLTNPDNFLHKQTLYMSQIQISRPLIHIKMESDQTFQPHIQIQMSESNSNSELLNKQTTP